MGGQPSPSQPAGGEALPGFKEIKPQGFGNHPVDANEYDSCAKPRKCSKTPLRFEPETSQALGLVSAAVLGILPWTACRSAWSANTTCNSPDAPTVAIG